MNRKLEYFFFSSKLNYELIIDVIEFVKPADFGG